MWPTPPTPMTAAVVPGVSRGSEPLHGVVGGDAGIGVRRDIDRVDAVRQPDERALVHEDVLGEAAVAGQTRELVPLAVDVEPTAAGHAQAAAVRRVDEDGVSDARSGDVVADRVHPACVLVTEDDGQREAGGLHEAVDRVQVGRAHSGAADLHDDAARAVRLGLGSLDELERAVVRAEERCPHADVLRYPFASASRCSASRVASAMIVSDGFTDSVRGTRDASPTKSRFTSCDSPFRSTTDRVGIVAHPAAALHVGGDEAGPADLRRTGRLEHVAAEPERLVDALVLDRPGSRPRAAPRRPRPRRRPSCCRRSPSRGTRSSGGTGAPPRRDACPRAARPRRRAWWRMRSGPGSSWPRSRSPRPRRAGASRSAP